MSKCLRMIGLCVSLSVLVGFLGFVVPMDAAGQPVVECPCDYSAVPQTTECWVEPFDNLDPLFFTNLNPPPPPPFATAGCEVSIDDNINDEFILLNVENEFDTTIRCSASTSPGVPAGCSSMQEVEDLTQEQFEACLSELQAYTTALNNVEGITVSGGPPYACGIVPPPPPSVRNVPTLSEWGLIAMAGILGIVGFMVMRRRKLTV